jgi:hypothetical protein
MKKITAIVMMMLFGLLSANLYAAEKDAAGCRDHQLIPRISGYYIAGCNDSPASFDMDIVKGKTTETIHIEGKSTALSYSPQPELKSKPSEVQLKTDFENTVKKQGGTQQGTTPGQKWPVYKMIKDGKEFWVVLMINSGEYYTGSYAYRIVEK